MSSSIRKSTVDTHTHAERWKRPARVALTAVIASAAFMAPSAAHAACGGQPNLNTRFYDGTHCGGASHSAFANDFVANLATWGFNDKASSLSVDGAVNKVRTWSDSNCSGLTASYHGLGVDTKWDTLVYSNSTSSYKTFTSNGDPWPGSPAACVNAT